jgi:hypothetical protein
MSPALRGKVLVWFGYGPSVSQATDTEASDADIRPESKDAGADGSHDNFGFALAAHPGKSRGRPDNNTSSQLIVRNGLPVACAPDTLIPVRSGCADSFA